MSLGVRKDQARERFGESFMVDKVVGPVGSLGELT